MSTIHESPSQTAFAHAMAGYFDDLNGIVGVAVSCPDRELTLEWNADTMFPTASTMKVPLLYELYRAAEAGDIDLTERVTLRADDRMPGSGVLQMLDPGLQPTVRDLAELMITVSDNYATDLLYGMIGRERLAAMLNEHGLRNTSLPMTIRQMLGTIAGIDLNAVVSYDDFLQSLKDATPEPDNLAYRSDLANDVSTPTDMVQILSLILNGIGVSDESRDAMLGILKNQNFSTIIPARLPTDEGIETAHKTGSLRGIRNDVGIVFGSDLTYSVAFMSKDQADTAEAVQRMAHASRWVWDFISTMDGTEP